MKKNKVKLDIERVKVKRLTKAQLENVAGGNIGIGSPEKPSPPRPPVG